MRCAAATITTLKNQIRDRVADIFATVSDEALEASLSLLSRERRYRIAAIAQKLPPEEAKKRRSEAGRKGAATARSHMSPEQRKAYAVNAARKRWGTSP